MTPSDYDEASARFVEVLEVDARGEALRRTYAAVVNAPRPAPPRAA